MGGLPQPDCADGPMRDLFVALHELHHWAGWPSLRTIAAEVGCSPTTISAAFSAPRLPRWGLLELIVEALGGDTGEFHARWLAATTAPDSVAAPWSAAPAPRTAPIERPLVRPFELPPAVPAFTGRREHLARLDALLAAAAHASSVTIAALSGTAGVGKTALAVHWAHQVAGQFPDGQVYLNLRGYDPGQPVHPADGLETMLRSLGVDGTGLPRDQAARAARYRTVLAGRRVLVVLDNARSVEQLRDLLPGTPSCFVVVTSRDALPALVARHGAERINLDLLPPREAVDLLGTLIGDRTATHPEHTVALADRCARLPLALRVAAELAVARPTAALAALVAELGQRAGRLDLLDAGEDEQTAVRAVFSWSLYSLPEPVASAFTLLGLHPGAELGGDAASALIGGPRRRLDILVRVHLLDALPGDRYGRHDLLREYAQERAARLEPSVRAAALDRLRTYYLGAATEAVRGVAMAADPGRGVAAGTDTVRSRSSAWLTRERANLLAVAADDPGRHTLALSTTLATYLDATGNYLDALQLHELARSTARDTGDEVAEGRAAEHLATVRRRLGDYRQAARWYRQALRIHRRTGDRAGAAGALRGLGLAYWRLGRYSAALHCLTNALTIYRDIGDRASEAATRTGLGNTYHQLGRYPEALAEHNRALLVQRAIGDRTGEGRTLNNAGLLEHRLGRVDAARSDFLAALEIAQEVGNPAGEGVALTNLADLDTEQGLYRTAADRYERALTVCRRIGYRVGEADALRGLGIVSLRDGDLDRALGRLGQAVAMCRELGERETEIHTLIAFGQALRAAGRVTEAIDTLTAARVLAEATADRHALVRAHDALADLCAGDVTFHRARAATIRRGLGLAPAALTTTASPTLTTPGRVTAKLAPNATPPSTRR